MGSESIEKMKSVVSSGSSFLVFAICLGLSWMDSVEWYWDIGLVIIGLYSMLKYSEQLSDSENVSYENFYRFVMMVVACFTVLITFTIICLSENLEIIFEIAKYVFSR